MKQFPLDEMKTMAKVLFSKAVSAVDPSHRLKDMVRIEKGRLLIKTVQDSEKVFHLDAFKKIFLI